MNSLKKCLCGAVLFFALLVIGLQAQPVRAAVKLNATGLNLCVGDTYKLRLSGTTKKITWKSSKPKVVKVASTGTVRALQAGSSTVTATVNKKSYSCKITVNKTFKVDQTSLSIKKNTEVTAFLSENGTVNFSIADKKICTVTFGKWDGDYMPLTIVPKKVGTTTITFTNSANSEKCTLKVKVTGIPVNASFQEPMLSTGAKTFIIGTNTMSFGFSLDRAAAKVNFKIYDTAGDVLRVISMGAMSANRAQSVVWDGRDADGEPVSGAFTYGVVADGTKTVGGTGMVYTVSPFGTGDGSESNPFLVSNQAELAMIKDFNGSCFAMDADIDFNYNSFQTLFSDEEPFTGVFDGKSNAKSYRIQNLYGLTSLFGTVGETGVIQNVVMSNCVLNTSGSLLATTNNGTIIDCSISGDIQCSSGNQAAMLAMYNKGQIRGCTVSGNMKIVASDLNASASIRAGGIAMSNTGTIVKCTSSVVFTERIQVDKYVEGNTYEIYTGGIVAENGAGAFIIQSTFNGLMTTAIQLPDALSDTANAYSGSIYSGFVAGKNNGYISGCNYVGTVTDLAAQGTGNGMVQ